jgi:hypothetical protein
MERKFGITLAIIFCTILALACLHKAEKDYVADAITQTKLDIIIEAVQVPTFSSDNETTHG